MSATTASLAAGVGGALVTFAVFLIVHALWIKPIWNILAPGAAIAVAGGLALGWSWSLVRPALPGAPWTAPALCVGILLVLLPGIALSYTHGPLFDLATATIPEGQGQAVFARFMVELIVPAALVGALIGWRLAGTGTAAGATALAAVVLAFGPGHNIPMFGTDPHALKGHAIVGILAVALSASLVALEALLGRAFG